MDQLLIGTSGYDYPEWKGVFYPPEIKRKDFLEYYAAQWKINIVFQCNQKIRFKICISEL